LLVFNNADDLELLRHVWPANSQGSILLTTRDPSAVHSPAFTGFQVLPFDDTTGSEVLLNLLGLDPNSSGNQAKAKAVTEALGGLPLALNQISGFIVQRRLPLQDCLPLYQRNAVKIDARKTGLNSYEHTLSTVWEMSVAKLSGHSRTLLSLLPYFQPERRGNGILHLLFPLHETENLGDFSKALAYADSVICRYPQDSRVIISVLIRIP
jgi:hypothetical protein